MQSKNAALKAHLRSQTDNLLQRLCQSSLYSTIFLQQMLVGMMCLSLKYDNTALINKYKLSHYDDKNDSSKKPFSYLKLTVLSQLQRQDFGYLPTHPLPLIISPCLSRQVSHLRPITSLAPFFPRWHGHWPFTTLQLSLVLPTPSQSQAKQPSLNIGVFCEFSAYL